MRGPITWQSLAAPDLRGVALMMNQAQNSINSGFGNLTDVLKQREATETANWNQQKTNNTNELFNKLAGYKTPEEYQAALNSGALQQEAAGYGAQVDQAAFRKALDSRMGDLQQRAVQGINYQTALDNEADVTKSGAATAAMGKGEYTQAGELIKGMSPRNQAAWFQKLEAQKDTDSKQAQQDVKVGFDLQDQAYKEKTRPIQEEILREQLAHSKAQTAEIGAKPLVAAAKAQREQAETDLKNYHKNDMYGSERFSRDPSVNAGHIYDTVAKVLGKDGDKASVALSTYFADPKNAEYVQKKADGSELRLPHNAAVIKQAMAMTESGFKKGTFFGIGSDAGYGDEYVKQVIANADKIMAESTKDINTPGAMNSYARLESLSNAARGDVVAPSGNATGLPKPAGEKPSSNTPSTALDKAAEKAGVTKPKEASEAIKFAAGVNDAVIFPGRVLYDAAGGVVNKVTDAINYTHGTNIPKVKGSLESIGLTPTLDAARAGNLSGPDVSLPSLTLGKSSAFSAPKQPTTSAPIAGNVGQAPAKVKQSESFETKPDGSREVVPPLEITKAEAKTLTTTNPVVTAKSPPPKGEGTSVKVTVLDADTFDFASTDPKQPVPNAVGNRCRWDTIDGQEIPHLKYGKQGQPFGEASAAGVKEILDSGRVTISVTGQDKRSDSGKARNICQVSIDGKPADVAVLKAGWAHLYRDYVKPNHPRYKELNAAEGYAITNDKGMFADGVYAEPGWENRRNK